MLLLMVQIVWQLLAIRNVFSKRARWANAPFMRQKKKKAIDGVRCF